MKISSFPATRTVCVVCTAILIAACSESANDLVAQGKRKQEQGDISAAIVLFKGAVQSAPDDAVIRYQLGLAHNAAFDGVSAEKELVKALELGLPKDGGATAALARSLWLQGNHQAIIERAEALPQFDGAARAAIHAYRGHAFVGLSKINEAKENLARAREVSGSGLPIIDLLEANILTSTRDTDAALAMIERVLKAHPQLYDALALKADILRLIGKTEAAIDAYGDLLAVHPKNLIALIGHTTLLIQLARFDEAEKDIQTLQSAYKDHFITHFQEGMLRFRKTQLVAALEAFQRALKLNRDYEPALLYEGMTQLLLGNAQSAQRSLNQYMTARPNDLLARRMLATALLRLQESARALEVMGPALESDAPLPEFWEIAGEAYARMGNFNKALEWLSKAERAKPENARIQQKQAEINMRRGRADLALADYADAARINKNLSAADTMLVLINLRSRDFERALTAVQAMEEKAPGEPFVANFRGVVLREQGRFEQAAAEFQSALKKNPAFLPAAVNLAQLDLREGKIDNAKGRIAAVLAVDKNHMQALLVLAGMEQRLGRPKEALELLERAADAHPRALEPRAQLADLLLRQGKSQQARERAEEAVTRNPNSLAALELLANVKMREGDKHSAVATFVRIVEQQPKSPAAHLVRARAERAAGMPKEAESSLRRALEVQKTYLPAQTALFELLIQQRQLPRATEFANQLKTEFPKSPIGYVFEGELLLLQKKIKEAIVPYRTALSLSRTGDLAVRVYQLRVLTGDGEAARADLRRWVDEHPRQYEARAQLAQAALEAGDSASALKQFQIVFQAAPASPMAANNLAWAYYKTGDLRNATRFAEGAKTLSPDDPLIDDTLGWVLLQQGKVREATDLLAKAAAGLKDRPDVRYHYAAALAKSGDRERALAEIKTALAMNIPFSERDEATSLLAMLQR